MNSMRIAFALLCVLQLTTSAARAQEYETEVRREVQYGTGGDKPLHLDLARPTNAEGKRPGLVYIHGGGWAQGSRAAHFRQVAEAARAGYVAVTITYRLAPQNIFPAQIEDCKCAVRWLRAHADELQLDPERIGAIGYSAGAHLSMLLGTMDGEDGLEGSGGWADQSSKVQAVVGYFGPTDLTVEYPPASRNIVKNFLGGTLEEKPDVYRRASPVTYVSENDAPMLLFQGTRDVLVPHDQAIRMVEAMTRAGVRGRVELLIGAEHGWQANERQRTEAAAMRFFNERLRP